MTRTTHARLAGAERYSLAEGILWDDRAGEAVWVDVHNGDVVRGLDAPTRVHLDTTVGAVALADDGGLLVAGRRGLIAIAADGSVSRGPDLVGAASRLNDGIVDPQGRFIVGSAAISGRSDDQVLLRVSPDGTVETLRSGLTLSNGLAFSPSGHLIYHVDTWAKTMHTHRYAESGWDASRWTQQPFDFTGYPDGMTIDASGTVWVAQYGAGMVQRFGEFGGEIERVLIDTVEATCPAILPQGLAITSGAESATDANAGAIFIADVDVAAVPEHRWAGNTSAPYWTL